MANDLPAHILLADKPKGPSSHTIVARLRRLMGGRRIGHAGTLDPAASGLLVLGSGAATRLLTYLVGLDKEYSAVIRLGEQTSTDDAEGECVWRGDPAALAALTLQQVRAAAQELTGTIQQVPSTFSAVKVNGKRAYQAARQGLEVELAAREVTVTAWEFMDTQPFNPEALTVRIACSSGTYIRALARDLGKKLGVGGHLTDLRRTRVGPFRLEDSFSLEAAPGSGSLRIQESANPNPGSPQNAAPTGAPPWPPAAGLLSPLEAFSAIYPVISINPQEAKDLMHGRFISLAAPASYPNPADASIPPVTSAAGSAPPPGGVKHKIVVGAAYGNHLVAIAELPASGSPGGDAVSPEPGILFRPKAVLADQTVLEAAEV